MDLSAGSGAYAGKRSILGEAGTVVLAVVALLCALPARAETPHAVVSVLAVRVEEHTGPSPDAEAYQSKLLSALRASQNFQTLGPSDIDERPGGRVARTGVLESSRPGDPISTAPVGLFGDRAIVVTLEEGRKGRAKADVYGGADGTLYYSITASRDRPQDVAKALDQKLAPRQTKVVEASDLVKVMREAPETAVPDWPANIDVRIDPPDGVTLAVHVRQEGESSFDELPDSDITEQAAGNFSIHIRPTKSGSFAYYIVALKKDAAGSEAIACTDGSDDSPNTITVDDRETATLDMPDPKRPRKPRATTSGEGTKRAPVSLALPPAKPATPSAVTRPPVAGATVLAIASAATILGAIFIVRTVNSAADRRTCFSVGSCEAKTTALETNQIVAWSLLGTGVAGFGIGGLAVGLHW